MEEVPLGIGEAEVVVGVVFGDAGFGDVFEFIVFGAGEDDEWGVELFEDVAVLFEEEGEEFFEVVGDDVEFEVVGVGFWGGGVFDGFVVGGEAEEFAWGEDVGAAEVEVGVWGGEAVEVGAGEGGEEEGVGVLGGAAEEDVGGEVHGSIPETMN